MEAMKQKILFFGNERIATGVSTTAPILEALIAAGYEIPAIVVAQNEASSSRKQRPLEVTEVAAQHNIQVIIADPSDAFKELIASFQAEAAVLVAFGKIVSQDIIDIFPKGIINIHPSLLPRHRGSIPIESVIVYGEKETGVSLMQLAVEMDAGPVYAQETVLLRGDETKQGLADQLSQLGGHLLLTFLPAILAGSAEATPQQEDEATYDKRLTKDDGVLDFTKPAEALAREVRAFAGWPRSRATIGTTEIIITQSHHQTGNGAPGTLWLDGKQIGLYGSEGILVIDRLIPSGKKEMTAEAFLAGYNPA
jgi:methionyl-tRNA formyltransferase